MTICIATSNYFPDTGGIATYSRRLATLMANAGHKAIVLTIAIEATIKIPKIILHTLQLLQKIFQTRQYGCSLLDCNGICDAGMASS